MNSETQSIIHSVAMSARLPAPQAALLLDRPFSGMKDMGLDEVEIGLLFLSVRERFPHASIDDLFAEHGDISIAELIHVCEAQLSWNKQ